jgi:two-component system chemotaxis response regulator CheY
MSDFEEAPSYAEFHDALEELEAGFMSMEADGDSSRALVHGLFRVAHNMKSTLSLAGFPGASSLMHEIEACLDAIRSNALVVDSTLTDALLTAKDAVKLAISRTPGASASLEEASEMLRAAASRRPACDMLRPISAIIKLDPANQSVAEAALADGAHLYILEKAVGPTMDDDDIDGLPIFDTIKSVGTIFARQRINSATTSVLRIAFAARMERTQLGDLLFDPFIEVGPPASRQLIESAGTADHDPAGQSARSREAVPASRPLRVLIVDDEPIAVHVLQAFVAPYALSDAAVNGREALEKFRLALAADHYDIVFLDIMMDDLPGFEVLSGMRRYEDAAGILLAEGARIIMTSSLSDYASVSQAFRNSCDAYLIKPVSKARVVDALHEVGIRNQITNLAR